ncbi:hypothetical protein SVIO_097870 [Streptomyces violaceusniger]|uniref:Peptidase M28 domain-containing protein n=1 Tax=Streptomyces violaceusniger TaxID=68280 RepID=A0A4D4LFL6_STRVO|nr:hypothetical protein SVIO_097870 [Streptomyces violaceusniger]
MSGWPELEKYIDRAPTSKEMMSWIELIVSQGIRRAGYPADGWTEEWAAEQFRETGLEDVRLEPLDTPIWRPRSAAFEIWPTDRPGEVIRFEGLALPYTTPTDGTEGRLVRMEDGEVRGSIAVQEIGFTRLPQTEVQARATGSYDPRASSPTSSRPCPSTFPM